MASGSSRSRVDQFFSSKKRKAASPGTKPGKKSTGSSRIAKLGSPGTKGTVEKVLLTSHVGTVKRNLTLGTKRSSFDVNDEDDDLEACQPRGIHRKESSEGSCNAGYCKDEGNKCDPPRQSHNRSDLKEFANDFLSLYCRDLQSTATSPSKPNILEHKTEGNSLGRSLLLESPLKRDPKSNYICTRAANDTEATTIVTRKISVDNNSREVSCANDPVQIHSTLRKCNKVHMSLMNAVECTTPGTMQAVAVTRSTPKSASGSSGLSPGEAFWSEAIQLVDGIFNTGNFVRPTALHSDGNGVKNLKDDEDCTSVVGKDKALLVEGVSPLPIKHLNFIVEGSHLPNTTIPSNYELHDHKENVEYGIAGQPEAVSVLNTDYISVSKKNEAESVDHDSSILFPEKTSGSRDFKSVKQSFNTLTPSSSVPLEDQLDLSNWLPPEVCSFYEKKGIHRLYPWQVDCLQVEGVLQHRNLVYCASTSAGKSFVAEILMLRRVLSTGKMALLVLPYVSICAEKAEYLEALLEPLGKHVRSYFGNQGGSNLPKDTCVAVCTIEKANALVNRLLEDARLSEVGIIVIDELHMVGDQHRGYLLELLLTKLQYASGNGSVASESGESSDISSKGDPSHGLQIVGMSATMPNVAAVADWLQAGFYETNFRPVPLVEFVKVGNTIYDRSMNLVRTLPKSAELGGKDPDHIVELCNEIVQEGHSVLIFCSSRKGCESTALHVSKFLKNFSHDQSNDSELSTIASAVEALQKSPAGLDPSLEKTLPHGVAYHHAGLTVEEREIVENCYRKGIVRVLTATSTLAAGVNLPARRVIFRNPRIGVDFIDGTRYRQMAGRAGRTGIDTKGESVLLCKSDELKRVMEVLNESCPPLQSCLSEDKNGMMHALLEVVAGRIVQTANDVHRYVKCTLLNSTKPFIDVVKSAQDSLRWLCQGKFVEWDAESKLYNITPLGRAAFGSSLCPEESLIVLADLSKAREGFVLASDLHLVYLVTPTNVEVEPDWELFYQRFMELTPLDQSVGNRVGVLEPFLMRMAHEGSMHRNKLVAYKKDKREKLQIHGGVQNSHIALEEQTLRVCRRFYVALMLARLVQETPVTVVCEAFKVARGMVQSLQENAGRFASMVSVFCERLGWHDLEGLVSKFQNRVSFGVRAEIVELTTIPYVKGSRARSLYKAGLRTPLAVAEASVSEIAKAILESTSSLQEHPANRHMHLGVAKKIKHGAQKIILDKAEEARIAAFSAFKSLGFNVPHLSLPSIERLPRAHDRIGSITPSEINAVKVVHFVQQDGATLSKLCTGEERPNIPLSVNKEEVLECVDGWEKDSSVKICAIAKDTNALLVPNEEPIEPSASYAPKDSGTCGNLSNHERKLVTECVSSLAVGSSSHVTEFHYSTCKDGKSDLKQPLQPGQNSEGNQMQNNSKNVEDIGGKSTICRKGPSNASSISGGFDAFLNLWENTTEFFFDIHYTKLTDKFSSFLFDIHGIAICWDNSTVYYINIPRDLSRNRHVAETESTEKQISSTGWELMKRRWKQIEKIMGKKNVRKFTWNLKDQIHVLRNAVIPTQRLGNISLPVNSHCFKYVNGYVHLSPIQVRSGMDISIISWILSPDEQKSSCPKLGKEVKKKLSVEAMASVDCSGRWKNQMRSAAHNGCCLRVAQIRALHSVLWKLIASEKLIYALDNIEMPLVTVLGHMEFYGIGVDMEPCLHARNVLGKKLKQLEREAHKLAGMMFSLYATSEIANVLYEHLKLPIPEVRSQAKLHPSTDKHSLDLLRDEHPIISVIKEHRTLAKLLNCTLSSICSLAKPSMETQKYSLHGHWLQTSTATGRLSMAEPNLQCVEHMIEFKIPTNDSVGVDESNCLHKINARDFFVPTEDNWLLLTADYSQIELRLMAHFSKDVSLIELLCNPHGDVFTMIAARWTRKPEECISIAERDHTKRLVYGILYGISAKTLSEQLNCSTEEASRIIKLFKSTFPGVASWICEAVSSCCNTGYVETFGGRKRFLSKITQGSKKEKLKAQRQAVNSICQGSAADIIKIAMVRLYSAVVDDLCPTSAMFDASKYTMLKDRCRILLQVHDELVLEVEPSVLKEAADLLKTCMETAASLLVPLQVKMKFGPTWGSLEPFSMDK